MPTALHLPICSESPAALAGYDRASLVAHLVAASGCTRARADRIVSRLFRGLYRDGTLRGWSAAELRAAGVGGWAHEALLPLSRELSLRVLEQAPSADGATRLLLGARDGALIESVIIPADRSGSSSRGGTPHPGQVEPRTTLCVSSQVGCARACTFCETGVTGLERQLATEEIVDQVRIARALCEGGSALSGAQGRQPTNVVFMGMGEPFDNLRAVARAVSLLTDRYAFAMPPARITVSTVGVADKLQSFFELVDAELAISLNAPDDARRSAIMPVNERFDLATLRAELCALLPPGRRVLFQYALFDGFNDSPADADRLADFVLPVSCRVNVIPANPGPDATLRTPAPERVEAFCERLVARGVTTIVRRPRGRDVGGACGQLAGARRRAAEPLSSARGAAEPHEEEEEEEEEDVC